MKIGSRVRRRDPRGQVVILVAAAMVAMVGMVGLIVDGGNAWAQQRSVQNGVDAMALAGAVELSQNFDGTPEKTDTDVNRAVMAAAAANRVENGVAYYTDVKGNLLAGDGSFASGEGSAARVGAGAIPSNTQGVRAVGGRSFGTYLTPVIGVSSLTTTADATAIAGKLEELCASGFGCGAIPVTFPTNVTGCDDSGKAEVSDTPVEWPVAPPGDYSASNWPDPQYRVTIPLCKNGPGTVGWLDWYAPSGGTSELIDSIESPDNPAFIIPAWISSQSGNTNSGNVEDALAAYAGQEILVPMFDGTCNTNPGVDPNTKEGLPCTTGEGGGQNTWYKVPAFAGFMIREVHTSGSNTQTCERLESPNLDQDFGNGATGCIVGYFIKLITSGEVGAGTGGGSTTPVGVQLIE